MYDRKNIENSPKLWPKETRHKLRSCYQNLQNKMWSLNLELQTGFQLQTGFKCDCEQSQNQTYKPGIIFKIQFWKVYLLSPFKQKPSKLKAILKERVYWAHMLARKKTKSHPGHTV